MSGILNSCTGLPPSNTLAALDDDMFSARAQDLLPSLANATWDLAYRTYGSSHATWIGLLGGWWIRLDPVSHSMLDGAPSFGKGRAGQGDALFCDSGIPVGILEVEGSEPEDKLWTIEQYFQSTRPELQSIWFGLLLLYSYSPKGSGPARTFPAAEDPALMNAARKVSTKLPDQSIVVLALDKQYGRHDGIRATSEYYSGTLCQVSGVHLQGGKERDRRVLFRGPGS